MEVSFIKGSPALLLKRERLLVIGDLHVGREIALRGSGIHLINATEKISRAILDIYKGSKARGIVLLGDVKDSISYPEGEEYAALKRFFESLSGINITITKGNHDANMEKLLGVLSPKTKIVRELILERSALMHGHTMPSKEAMKRGYIIIGHSHPAVRRNGGYEKVWTIAEARKEAGLLFDNYNKRIKLIMVPAFNELITGSSIRESHGFVPLLRKNAFDLEDARVYDLQNHFLGKAREMEKGL